MSVAWFDFRRRRFLPAFSLPCQSWLLTLLLCFHDFLPLTLLGLRYGAVEAAALEDDASALAN